MPAILWTDSDGNMFVVYDEPMPVGMPYDDMSTVLATCHLVAGATETFTPWPEQRIPCYVWSNAFMHVEPSPLSTVPGRSRHCRDLEFAQGALPVTGPREPSGSVVSGPCLRRRVWGCGACDSRPPDPRAEEEPSMHTRRLRVPLLFLSLAAVPCLLVPAGCSTPSNPPPVPAVDCGRVSLCDLGTTDGAYMCFEDSLYTQDFSGSLGLDQGHYEQYWDFTQPNGVASRLTLRMYRSLAEPCDVDLPMIYCYVGGYLLQSQPGVTDPGTAYLTLEELGTGKPPLVSWGDCEYLTVLTLSADDPDGIYEIRFNDIVLANAGGETRVVSLRVLMI